MKVSYQHFTSSLSPVGNIVTTWLVTVLAITASAGVYAKGFSAERFGFPLRFDAAISRFANYADALGAGGASAGSTFASSANPASTAWRPLEGHTWSISPQVTKLDFDNGSELDVYILGGVKELNPTTRIEFAYARADSNREPIDVVRLQIRPDFKLEADLVTLGISHRRGRLAYGGDFGIRWTKSKLTSDSLPIETTDGTSYGANVGLLYELLPAETDKSKLTWGLVAGLGTGNTERKQGADEDRRQFIVRTGLSWRLSSGRYLFADYQYSKFKVKGENEKLSVSRLFAGLSYEIRIKQVPVYLRAGGVLDKESNESYTLGLGTILDKNKRFGIDIAYQKNMFPELEPEFGGSELVNVSVRLKF